MPFEMKDASGNRIEIVPGLPEELKHLHRSHAVTRSAVDAFGNAVFYAYPGNGFTIWDNRYDMKRPATLFGRSDGFVLELSIALKKYITGTWDGIENPGLLPKQFNLNYTPHVLTKAIFDESGLYETCDIHFERWFLDKIARDFPLLADFLELVDRGVATELSKQRYFCTKAMITAIEMILDCNHQERWHRMNLEGLVILILTSALELMEDQSPARPVKLLAYDIDQLHKAKVIIESDLMGMPSIVHLSEQVALNLHKLKQGFKMLFGVSPYKHFVNIRMKEAGVLLLNTDKTVSEIARMVGYLYDNNFTIEFKKHYGCTPTYFRNNGTGGKK